jgi:hypothetical protein
MGPKGAMLLHTLLTRSPVLNPCYTGAERVHNTRGLYRTCCG